jgi:uncharacterized protein YlxP (DUF503 family)
MGVVVGCLYLDLFISEAQSLKDKRRVLRRLKDKAHLKFHVAVAETDDQELWQRARLAFVSVSNERQQVDRTLGAVADWAAGEPGFVISDRQLEWR